jgi:hypothetical protein
MLWFPKGFKKCPGKFKHYWFGPYHVQYYLPNTTILLVNMDKFDLNPMFVNTKKLKPYLLYDNYIIGPLSKFKRGKGDIQHKHMNFQKKRQRRHWMEKVREKHQ